VIFDRDVSTVVVTGCVASSDGSYRFTLGNEFTESRSQEGIIH
jgi:hypothetical protein